MFPQGKMKAITFSFDDGVEQDRKLVEILNRFGFKAAFNLNSGVQSGSAPWCQNDLVVRRLNIAELPGLYAGHEIAVHSLTHPHLEYLDEPTIRNELEQDKLNLERIFNTKVRGMAYPYGTYNALVTKTARRCGLEYARGVSATGLFDIPQTTEERLAYQPTCNHDDPQLMTLADAFLKLTPQTPQLFYIWGHSYMLEANNNWHVLEEFCKLTAGRNDIFYGTNAEVLL